MKTSEIKQILINLIKAGLKQPIHIEGAPGGGKSQVVAQVAKELGIGFICVHAPLMQPEDYGFPVINADKTDVSFIVSQSKFPIVGSKHAKAGILLFDDMTQADNTTQKILAQAMQEREIHGQAFLPDWIIVSTGNRTTDRAGANRLLSHLGNRLTRIELDLSIDDWTTWAFGAGVRAELIAFLRFKSNLLSNFDPQQDISATPRSWVQGVNAFLGVVPAEHEFTMFKGSVGEGPASEFCAFLKIFRSLPNVDLILVNPDSVPVPKIGTDANASSVLYALCGSLASKASAANFGRLMKYVSRMPDEFQVLFIRDAVRMSPEVQTTPEFIQWASGPGAKLLI